MTVTDTATEAAPKPRLKLRYQSEIKDALQKEFGIANVMLIPGVTKVVVNMGVGEAARDAKLIEGAGAEQIDAGIVLSHPQGLQLKSQSAIGRLYFQTKPVAPGRTFGTVAPDNKILASVLELREEHPDMPVILVSKDINLRIKAAISGLVAEDYENDRALDDFSLLFTGATELSADFWDRHEQWRWT